MRRYLSILFLLIVTVGLVHASGNTVQQILPHSDPADEKEFQNVYQSIVNPIISTGTAQNFTIVNGSVTTLTAITETLKGNLSFIPTTKGIVGSPNGDNAQLGVVGEYVPASVAQSNAVNTPASDSYGDITSINLTAGDWDITGIPSFTPSAATGTRYRGGISTTAGNSSAGMSLGDTLIEAAVASGTLDQSIVVPAVRMSFSTTTTVYLKALATFSAGQPKMYGRISARRMR